MEKKSCFLFVVVVLFVFLLTPYGFAKDNQIIIPVLSDDNSIEYFKQSSENELFLIAVNTQPIPEDDELTDELMDDYADDEAISVADPLYYLNYVMYTINDVLYHFVLKPVAQGYKAITPTSLRKGVNNFFHNLMFPVRFINNLLQGKIGNAGSEVGIFLVNSTAGFLGFGQVAQEHFDMKTSDEDLGQTLGSYGIGNGFYIVLPLLGPSTLRDTIGRVGDYFITPINHPNTDFFDYGKPWKIYWGLQAVDAVNYTSLHIGDYEALKKAAVNPYIAIRDAYIKNRAKKVAE